jgi:hypothetical protein
MSLDTIYGAIMTRVLELTHCTVLWGAAQIDEVFKFYVSHVFLT